MSQKVNSVLIVFLSSIVMLSATPLTCQNIHSGAEDLPNCKMEMVSNIDGVEYIYIKCAQLEKNRGTGLSFKFRIIENTTFDGVKNLFTYCAGLKSISSFHMIRSTSETFGKRIISKDNDEDTILEQDLRTYLEEEDDDDDDDDDDDNLVDKKWSSEFNDMIAVGSIVVHKTCITNSITAGSCTTELRLKPNVYKMHMFHYKITKREFWNFTDPMFHTDGDWLRSLTTIGYKYDLHYLLALENTSLQELKISKNPYSTSDVFLGKMSELKIFHFQRGNLNNFNSGNCNNKPILTEISFMENMLEIPPHGLSSCQELKVLDMSNQNIAVINKDELSSMTKLEQLNLSNADIKGKDFLPPLPNLKVLNLSSCYINNLSIPEPFRIFPKLENLDLSYIFIDNIDEILIKGGNLKVLNFSHDYRKVLSNVSLVNLNLKILDLSNSGLTRFPHISSCKIEQLNLAKNHIETIENFSLNNVTVSYLDLSDSMDLEGWTDKNVFKNKQFNSVSKYNYQTSRSWVNKLNMTKAGIVNFTDDMTFSMRFLTEVDLQDIPISCLSCKSSFIEWVNSDRTTKILHVDSKEPLLACADKGMTVQQFSKECVTAGSKNRSSTGRLSIFAFILLITKLK